MSRPEIDRAGVSVLSQGDTIRDQTFIPDHAAGCGRLSTGNSTIPSGSRRSWTATRPTQRFDGGSRCSTSKPSSATWTRKMPPGRSYLPKRSPPSATIFERCNIRALAELKLTAWELLALPTGGTATAKLILNEDHAVACDVVALDSTQQHSTAVGCLAPSRRAGQPDGRAIGTRQQVGAEEHPRRKRYTSTGRNPNGMSIMRSTIGKSRALSPAGSMWPLTPLMRTTLWRRIAPVSKWQRVAPCPRFPLGPNRSRIRRWSSVARRQWAKGRAGDGQGTATLDVPKA